jgi:16S rRNA (guanine527-N7)-methyltransferase
VPPNLGGEAGLLVHASPWYRRAVPKGDVSTQALAEGVSALAASFSQEIDPTTVERVATFGELLLRWNARINLTGARNSEELLREHFPDSFAMAALVPLASSLVDVGSGGGLPALPFSLLRPDVSLTVVEPRAKRVAFLRTAVRELGLAVTVVSGRAEEVNERFSVASSRATFPPPEWLSVGSALVRPGGEVLFLVHEPGELPFPPSRQHRIVRYKAGSQARVAAALAVVPDASGG